MGFKRIKDELTRLSITCVLSILNLLNLRIDPAAGQNLTFTSIENDLNVNFESSADA
ncbi:hypothetical protein [Metabacillus arenae]|uniref:Uncharacterized protein n=1 Tax=Metabacillus arenae TaxID=2771434 RepID=A0A926NIM3_9BACI|nr:hypothetical protein [Metabacillus arenae]MBD1380693.1 hypothetical protein [Metabacillus arenae]